MADLTIVAGECGRGSGEYDTGVFKLPGPSDRGAETIAEIVVHGDVGEKQPTLGQMLGGLRGGLALAQQLDLSAPSMSRPRRSEPASARSTAGRSRRR